MKRTIEDRWGSRRFAFDVELRSTRQFRVQKPKSKLKKNSGQALVEYVLLLSLAAGLAVALNATFNSVIGEGILELNAVLQDELSTGNFTENKIGGGGIWTQGDE